MMKSMLLWLNGKLTSHIMIYIPKLLLCHSIYHGHFDPLKVLSCIYSEGLKGKWFKEAEFANMN